MEPAVEDFVNYRKRTVSRLPQRKKMSRGRATLRLFEIALVLVRLGHVASIRGNGQRVGLRYTSVSKLNIAKPTQAGVS